MAFEQNGIPGTLRPLNIVRPGPVAGTFEESFSVPVTTTARNMEGIIPNSGCANVCGTTALPVYYASKVPDTSLAGYPGIGASNWFSQVPGAAGGSPVIGMNHTPDLVGNMISGNASDQMSEDGGDESSYGKKVKFLCSIGGKILPRPNDGLLRYVGGDTRIISVRKDVSYEELLLKMANTYGQLVAIKYQLPDEDLDALVSVSCPDDLENMMEEYEKLVERSPDGSAKLRVFLFPISELDSLGMSQFEDLSGDKYVDAVNGILDDDGGNLARKESIASAESLSLSVAEVADISGPFSQGDVAGIPPTGILSPAESIAASQENSPNPRLASAEPIPTIHSDPVIPISVPLVSPVVTQPLPVLLDCQVGSYRKQPVMESNQPHPQAYFAPHQEMLTHPNSIQIYPQMGYPHQQLLRTAVPVIRQPQLNEKLAVGNMHLMTPALQVASAPTLRTNVTHPLVQCPSGGVGNYSTGGTFTPAILQVPIDHNFSHSTCTPQIPPSGMGGSVGWSHVRQNQYNITDTSMPYQQVTIPETMPNRPGCYMCQRALPHAHSDMLVQENKDGLPSPVSDSNSNNSSHGLGENLQAALMQTPIETKAPNESKSDQGTGAHIRVTGHADYRVPLTNYGVPQNMVTYSYEKMVPQNSDYLGKSRMILPHHAVGTDARSPYSVLVGNNGQPFPHLVANPSGNKLLYNEPSPGGCMPFQAVQHVVYAKPGGNPSEAVTIVPKEALGIAANYPRPIYGCMDELSVARDHVIESHKLARPGYGELLEHKTVEEALMESCRSGIGSKTQIHSADVQPCRHTEVPSRTTPPPIDIHAVKQLNGAAPGPNPQLNTAHPQANLKPASHINPSDGSVVQDSSNSLFSNQDPWNMWQEVHFRPRVPTRFAATNEPFGAREEPADDHFVGNFGGRNKRAEQPLGNINKDVKEHVPHKGEPTTQEPSDFHINMAASTPQSAAPYDQDSSLISSNKLDFEANQVKDDQTRDGVQRSPRVEDARGKLLDPGNLGFPESDGLGRLQIISNNDLEELQELGSGTFGTVYHGKWRGTDVAIKRISNRCFIGKPSEQDRMRKDFWNEAVKLADLHHPNVVAFYGVVLDGPGGSMATVTEYMVNGSLRTALQKNERCLDKRKRLLILMDVAFGMEYLHGKNIVHFDLKSDNLLVNLRDSHRPVCKVGDLGLSKVKCKTLISGGVRGTLPWMAPELLNGSSSLVSEKVDVYSFGIVMWELLTGEEPYADLHYGTIIGGIVSNTLRPTVPESCDLEWRSLMERCWSSEPSERPNFTEAANQLRAMATNTKIQK
uniref:Protein kinase domain-containing protein n=1 Tax=Kalanchoe fedtschenkoi TaxID=63787 RepID=A0A7N0SWI8_KALFE